MKSLAVFVVALFMAFPAWAESLVEHAENLVHHKVQFTLEPNLGKISVTDHMTLTGQGGLGFVLSSAFEVGSLRVDGVVQKPNLSNEILTIELGSKGAHTIEMTTHAKLPQRIQPPFLRAQGGLIGGDWLAHPKGYKATWDVMGQSPKGQKWLIPGTLQFESEDEKFYRARFTSERPAVLPILISGPFEVHERWVGDIRLRTYFHSELTPQAEGYLTDTARYIKDAVKNIGPYPYTQFSIVSGIAPVGWGLPGMTYMGRRVLALPFIRTTSLPHEILHNWWGNAVDVAHGRGNWAEGLTTFQADLVQSALKNKDGGKSKRIEWLRNFQALPKDLDKAVNQFKSKTHDAAQVVGYGKTAFVFHMLKKRIGRKAFTDGIRLFYKDHQFKTAAWSDLQAAFERTSKQDLEPFFKAWITRPGAPELVLSKAQSNSNQVTFTLQQRQKGPVYPLDIAVRLSSAQGHQTSIVRMDRKEQSFTIATTEKSLSLSIDSDFDIFRRLNTAETPPILRDVTLNANTRLVVEGHDPNLQAFAVQVAEHLLQRPLNAKSKSGPRLQISLSKGPLQAEAFVKRAPSGQVTLYIQARSINDLAKFARVLPHYKRRSFIKFQGDRVVEKGVWQITSQTLTKIFGP